MSKPVLARFLHQKEQNRVVEAVSTGRFSKRDGDAAFMPHVLVSQGEGGLRVSPVRMGDNPDTFVQANGVELLESGRECIPGETIQVQLLPRRDASPEANA